MLPSRTGTVSFVPTSATARIWAPLLTLWLVWGSTYLGIAVMGKSAPPLLTNGLRLFVGGLALALLVRLRGRSLRLTRAQLRSVAILGVGIIGVGIGTLSLAERFVPSSIAALLVSSVPLWVVLLRRATGQPLAAMTLAGVVVGLIGLAVMLLPGGSVPVSGTEVDVLLWSLAICVSSFTWSFFSFRSQNYDLPANSLVTTVYELLFGGAGMVLVGVILGERLHVETYPLSAYAAWGYLIVASIVGYACYTYLLANARLSLISTYAYINPVVAVLLGVIVLHEPITRAVVVGLTIVVGGVVLVVSGERRTS